MHRLLLWAAVLIFLPGAFSPAAAQFYRYIDREGVVRFTDDPGKVPEGQREPPAAPTESPGNSRPADASGTMQVKDPPAAGKPQTASSEEDSEKEELKIRKAALKSEYDALMKEKERIEEESEIYSKRLRTRKRKGAARSRLNELEAQKMTWSKKFDEYEGKRKVLEKAIGAGK